MNNAPFAVVFAGGQGTRLWPISRRKVPKQFQPILGTKSMLRMTVDRVRTVVPPERIFISTSVEYSCLALEHVPEVTSRNLILEDSPLGPAGAFSAAMEALTTRFGDVPVITTPSDHYVGNLPVFTEALSTMLEALHSYSVVALGAPPTRADRSLGYIESAAVLGGEVDVAQRMIEKPSRFELDGLGSKSQACWNTACYAVNSAAAVAAYERFDGESRKQSAAIQSTDSSQYPWHELAPFFARSDIHVGLVLRDVVWRDVGTWPGLLDALGARDFSEDQASRRNGNVIGSSLDGRQIVAIDVDDLVIVSHHDAVYVMSREGALNASIIEGWRAEKHRDHPELL